MTGHKKPQGAPREWWIHRFELSSLSTEPFENGVHVIEHSAYLDLQRQLDKAQEDATFCRENYAGSVKLSESLLSKLADSEYALAELQKEHKMVLEIGVGQQRQVNDQLFEKLKISESKRLRLVEAGKRLLGRIEHNGGIGDYNGGPAFVVEPFREALIAAADEVKDG